jgi:hypothetical protein
MMKKNEAYEKVVDIKDFPDLGGAPELLETTTLSDKMKTYIPGIQSSEGLPFTSNYTAADFARLQALEGSDHEFAVWFGGDENADGTATPTGKDGKFSFKGAISSYVTGTGTNSVRDIVSTIAPSTPISFAQGA